MKKLSRLFRLQGLKRRYYLYLVNKVYAGTNPKKFEKKRKLLNAIGFQIDEGTKIVGPIECSATLKIGKNCWIGKNFCVNGNGTVVIGDNCDIAPEVTFQTGGHLIGSSQRRAGEGIVVSQTVGDGTWIGGGAMIVNNVSIGAACVVAARACVTKNVEDNMLVGGVPARVLRRLDE